MSMTTNSFYYKYMVVTCDVIIGSTVYHLKHADILSMGIEKDFDNDYLPIFNLKLSLDYELYYNIIQNKTSVFFKVKLVKYSDPGKNNVLAVSARYKETVFEELFSIYIEDNISAIDKDLYDKTKNTIGKPTTKIEYDFYLFRDSSVKAMKYSTNEIVTYSNLTNVLVYLFCNAGIVNLLLSPLDNCNGYSEILIPYKPLTQTVNYLEQFYGLYRYGAMLFFDFDTTYLLSNRATCTAFRDNEYTGVILTFFKPGTMDSITAGCQRDDVSKKLIIRISQDNMQPITESIITEQTSFLDELVINSSENTKSYAIPQAQSRTSNGRGTKVVLNKYNNPYITDMIKYRKMENDKIINVTLYDIDITFLTPNKIFYLVFDDKASDNLYGGRYRLSKMVTTFIKGGTEFSSTTQVQFKASE